MNADDFKNKVAFIVETDGLLRDYIDSVIIKQIKSKITDDKFNNLNPNHIHAALILKNMAPCSLKAFAGSMRLSKSAASALVDRMVENGVVERQPNPSNRREVLLSVNPDFERHVAYVKSELAKWFEELTAAMGMDLFEKWYSVMTELNRIIKRKINSDHV